MFKLPELGYGYGALEPFIDEQTMEIHYNKHHGGYVEKLNKALEGEKELLNLNIEDLLKQIENVPESVRQNVINNGGGHANHSLFWKIMKPGGMNSPEGELLEKINQKFGSFEEFKNNFNEKALSLFGSGWVFLEMTGSGLNIKRHSFQNNPLMYENVSILGLDVWEHAYYLKYQNRRADYVDAWWNVVNWDEVNENYLRASK